MWECYYPNDGKAEEFEKPYVCRESLAKTNGKVTSLHREKDWPDDELLKKYEKGEDACWNADDIGEGKGKHEMKICICNKDLCNNKFKLPKGEKVKVVL